MSRAAIYRLEKGEVVKIETIQRIADLLNVSVASLLGVSVEYYDNAVAYFERMRQLEEEAEQILAHFAPFSYLLSSDEYAHAVELAIRETVIGDVEEGDRRPGGRGAGPHPAGAARPCQPAAARHRQHRRVAGH